MSLNVKCFSLSSSYNKAWIEWRTSTILHCRGHIQTHHHIIFWSPIQKSENIPAANALQYCLSCLMQNSNIEKLSVK